MDNYEKKLADLMFKIAYKVPWQNLNIIDDELRLLDQASGKQMAEIAYNNRIPFTRFIHNADEIIDSYNENQFRRNLKDLRELKIALEAPIRMNEFKQIEIEPIELNSDEREREIMQAVINEVLEGSECTEPDIDINAINTLLAQQQQQSNQQISSFNQPSEHRPDFSSLIHRQISLHEKQNEKDLAKVSMTDELPEINMDQLGELGLLDGPQGRRIFENIYDKENEKNFPRRTDEEPTNIEISLNNPEPQIQIDMPNNLQLSIENEPQMSIQNDQQVGVQNEIQMSIQNDPKVVAPINQTRNESDESGLHDDQYAARLAIVERTAAEVAENQQKEKVATQKVRRARVKATHRIRSILNFYKPLIVNKAKKILKKRKNPYRISVIVGNNEKLNFLKEMKEFFEYELPDYDEDEEEIFVDPKEKMVTSELPTVELEIPHVNMEICDVLVNKEAPQNIVNLPDNLEVSKLQQSNIELPQIPDLSLEVSMLQQVNMEIPESLLSNMGASKQQANLEIPEPTTNEASLTTSNIREAPQSILELPELPIDNLTLPDIPKIPQISLEESNKRPNASPELKNDSKRTKITQDLEIPEMTITNQRKVTQQITNGSIQVELSSIAPPDISSPRPTPDLRSNPQSSITSAFEIFRRKLNPNGVPKSQVTAKDIEYSRLMQISKQVESTLPEVSQQQLEVISEEPPVPTAPTSSIAPQGYKEFKKNGLEIIQFKENAGNLFQIEEFNAENFVLYLQLRKFMKKKGSWKLNVQRILNDEILKLVQIKSKRVIEQRLWFLCDQGLLKGTWSEDDLHLIEVEIPIQCERQAENKENVP